MHIIENKSTSITINSKNIKYSEIILGLIESPKDIRGGWTRQEMRQANKVENIIENANDNIELEDADFNYVRERVINNENWSFRHKDLLEFIDYIAELKPKSDD